MHHKNNFLLRHTISIGTITMVVFLLLTLGMFYRQDRSFTHIRGWMVHTYDVSQHIQRLFDTAQNALRGQRSYALSGNETYLSAYRNAAADSSKSGSAKWEIAQLRNLTSDNQVQQRLLDEVEHETHDLLAYLSNAAHTQPSQDIGRNAAMFDPDTGNQFINRIHTLVTRMNEEENKLMSARAEADARANRYNSMLFLSSIVLFYAGMLLLLLLAVRQARHARHMEREVLQANAQLNESQVFLRNIINHVPDPIFVKDAQHRWTMGNTALWALFGKREEELLGKSDYDFFPKEEADIFWQKDQEVFRSGETNINTEHFTDAAGVTHIISTRKTCFHNAAGDAILVGVIRDITELACAQEKLKASDEARIKSIMDHSARILSIKDMERRYIQVNKPLLDVLERSEQDMIGKTDHDLFPKEYADISEQNDVAVLTGKHALEFEEIIPLADGPHTYRTVKFPLYDASEQIYALCSMSTDITERKQSEEIKRLLSAIVTSSDDAIISKTPNGIITSWNLGAERIFGYTAEEAIGQHISLIVPPERMEEERHILAEMLSGKTVSHFETMRRRKDGRLIAISLTLSPIYDTSGRIVGASKVARDITEHKLVEAKLLRYTHELERSNQELDDFAYIASHDLKEPLRGLYNHASFLLEDYAGKLDEDGVRRLNRLAQLSQRMEQLVNDLLYFSRLGRSDLAIQKSDPNEMVADIKQMLESFLKEHNARILVPARLPLIVCDKPRITEVFRNLITNAIKYNDKPEKMVEVGFLPRVAAPHGEEQDVFYVRDNGIGIEKEFHEQIFRIFKRLQPAGEKENGTGVGLTFVKKIIERHKGHIWLESSPKNGSTFYFTTGKRDS